RAIVEDTKVRPMPWQRTGKSKSRWQEFARDAHALRRGAGLKLCPGQPGSVDRCCNSTPVAPAEDRGVQNVDRFVVETFEDCAGQVLTRINRQHHWAWLTRNCTRAAENKDPVPRTTGRIFQNEGLRTEGRNDVAHVDVPPVGAQRQTFNPFRAVNSAVGPF